MSEPGLITLCGAAHAPLSHVRAAMLVAAIASMIAPLPFLFAYPPPIHRVRIDLSEAELGARAERLYHRLEVTADGRMILDGRPRADLVELRMGLDHLTLDPEAGLELRPHPELRYETFLEVLALTRRANVAHLLVTIAPAETSARLYAGPGSGYGAGPARSRDFGLRRAS